MFYTCGRQLFDMARKFYRWKRIHRYCFQCIKREQMTFLFASIAACFARCDEMTVADMSNKRYFVFIFILLLLRCECENGIGEMLYVSRAQCHQLTTGVRDSPPPTKDAHGDAERDNGLDVHIKWNWNASILKIHRCFEPLKINQLEMVTYSDAAAHTYIGDTCTFYCIGKRLSLCTINNRTGWIYKRIYWKVLLKALGNMCM